ncbi:phage portal protein [Halorhodospira neutriphila]|uniref:Phage portal protein n=1 Tax=Halorhodospira neutriphila TaxID=168379 RepID=A0ABS1E396_9GAMM|nr:phage portal protein [Halorhodospira neutriphila]MBK1725704.1 phage portal protein [Halorhodospira neutriphila]
MTDEATAEATSAPAPAEAFAFGDPEPVLEGGQIQELSEAIWMGRWYDPPVSPDGLYRAYRSNPHHSSAIQVKRNILMSCWRPSNLIGRGDLSRAILDYLVYGNLFLWVQRALSGRVQRLRWLPARYMRVGSESYWYAPSWLEYIEYEGDIVHIQEPDPGQEIYGVPEYLAALQSALLNEAATLFRRKYYLNGSHAGFIMYLTDAIQQEDDIDNIRQALRDSKGPGNFRNLFLYAPGGKKDGLQIIPVSEVQAKDEFFNVKNISRDDVLAAHRIPPQLMGIVPTNTAGFGDAEKAAKVFARNELQPLQARLAEVNDQVGANVLTFDSYQME